MKIDNVVFLLVFSAFISISTYSQTNTESEFNEYIQNANMHKIIELTTTGFFPQDIDTLENIFSKLSEDNCEKVIDIYSKTNSNFQSAKNEWKFFNPIIYTMGINRLNITKYLIEHASQFIDLPQSSGKSFDSYRPLTFAVIAGSIDIITIMLEKGASVDYKEGFSSMNRGNSHLGKDISAKSPLKNCLSFSNNKEIQDVLIQYGVPEFIEWKDNYLSSEGRIEDDNVNMRSSNSLNSIIIKKFKPDERVTVLGVNTRLFSADKIYGYWFKVEDANKKIGWVFSKYINNYSWYEM